MYNDITKSIGRDLGSSVTLPSGTFLFFFFLVWASKLVSIPLSEDINLSVLGLFIMPSTNKIPLLENGRKKAKRRVMMMKTLELILMIFHFLPRRLLHRHLHLLNHLLCLTLTTCLLPSLVLLLP
ncbi:hypothetical protein V6Z12_A09G142200 [Gossypium hirsutum]